MNPHVLVQDQEGVIFSCPSQSQPDEAHTVAWDDVFGWWCSCEHYTYRKVFCKHMEACRNLLCSEGLVLPKDVFHQMEVLDDE